MKAIGIKMVDLQLMTANEAIEKGYKTNNYDVNIGKKFARPHAIDQIWAGLGFVLQWAKYGLALDK